MDRIPVVVRTETFSATYRQGEYLLQVLQVLVVLHRPLLLRSVLSVTPTPFAFALLLVVVMLALMATILTFDDR